MSYQTATAYPPYGYRMAAPPRPRTLNGLALASIVISIHGFGLPGLGVVGAILGHVAHAQIRERDEDGHGLATGGIVIGWGTTGLYVLAALAVVILIASA